MKGTLGTICGLLLVVLVPFAVLGWFLEDTLGTWITWPGLQTNPLILALVIILILAADILLPVPSSLVCWVGGVNLGWFLGTLVAWIGLNLGANLGFFLARSGAKWLRAEQAHNDVEPWGAKWKMALLLFSRPVPLLAEATVLWAGWKQWPFARFWPPVVGANLGFAAAFTALGTWTKDNEAWGIGCALALGIPVGLALVWVTQRKHGGTSTVATAALPVAEE